MEDDAQENHLLGQIRARRKDRTIPRLGQAIPFERRLAGLLNDDRLREIEAREAARRVRSERERLASALAAAGIPPKSRFWSATLSSYRTGDAAGAEALRLCVEAVDGFAGGGGLLLVGEPGGGKTHLLVGMLRAAIERGLSAKYLTLADFFAEMRGCIVKGRSDLEHIEELAAYQVLALDDMHSIAGAKSATEESYQYEKLWHLLDKRYFRGHATLAATNRDIAGFRAMLDERTRRRLQAIQVAVPKRRE